MRFVLLKSPTATNNKARRESLGNMSNSKPVAEGDEQINPRHIVHQNQFHISSAMSEIRL